MVMAGLIGQTAREHGLEVDVRNVQDVNTQILADYDGIVVGSPTYFSNVSWQIKKLLDETYPLRRGGFKLKGKIGGGFTSSDTRVDGEDCVRMIDLALNVHHEMETVPGIIVTRGETDAEIYEICRNYGAEIAEKILGA